MRERNRKKQKDRKEKKVHPICGEKQAQKLPMRVPSTSDLTDEDFKASIINMLKEIKETLLKEV